MVITVKLFFTVTKRMLVMCFLGVVAIVIVCSASATVKLSEIDGSTHENRISYIKSLGYQVNEEKVTSKEIVIPEKFGDVYTRYNEIQKEAHFDLSRYTGRKATVYNYPLWDDSRVVNIIVVDGKIVGGDVCEIRVDGEMKPLK